METTPSLAFAKSISPQVGKKYSRFSTCCQNCGRTHRLPASCPAIRTKLHEGCAAVRHLEFCGGPPTTSRSSVVIWTPGPGLRHQWNAMAAPRERSDRRALEPRGFLAGRRAESLTTTTGRSSSLDPSITMSLVKKQALEFCILELKPFKWQM